MHPDRTDPIDEAPTLPVDDEEIRFKLWAVMTASQRAGAANDDEPQDVAACRAGELLALIADSQKKAAN